MSRRTSSDSNGTRPSRQERPGAAATTSTRQMSPGTPDRTGFTAAECAWLDQARRGWVPLSEKQARVVRHALRPARTAPEVAA
ncbi:hypothetical protein A5733_04345 [Mycobacterium sp. NS-7484]|uniref:hypothetical protein n=1 Tax=Mycobacterium sp. NS-7484 TaxID=1834161 RepID=UPI00096D7A27|nr:hypothetical protein [Mycobacterium sp. NS-7484]OMC00347.1 hypothetical protein A5733_04345 [Mycobacterium sp. NS-7484]